MDETIQTFALYDEGGPFVDLVHCETLADRAARHGWVIRPHRHAQLHQILSVTQGEVTVTVDGQRSHNTAPCLINMPSGSVHGYRFSEGAEGHVATLSPQSLPEVFSGPAGLAAFLSAPVVLGGDDDVAAALERLRRLQTASGPGRAAASRGTILQILAAVADQIHQSAAAPMGSTGHLFDRFEALITDHLGSGWRVADYAKALAVTPAQLTRACHRAQGRSAGRLLSERLAGEAARQLAYTRRSISDIAYDLGFEDPAYFARAFRREMGLSPTAFRQKAAG